MPLLQENQIQMAISAIQNKKVCSNRRAASIFEVPEPTLCAYLKERKLCSETRANSYKLTELEEEVLAKCLLDIDK
jgi:hypothetical protein